MPNFLIIGAMKAGTTTLYEDLLQTPDVYLPPEKEPEDLAFGAVETPAGRARYEAKFRLAPAGAQAIGEASTIYTKRPLHEGAAGRAVRVLGPGLRVIYMTRDPVKRIVSQYRHLVGLGEETRPFEVAIAEDPAYVAFSRYDWQLEPWRAVLPRDQIMVLPLEDYLADRSMMLGQVRTFLGLAGPYTSPTSHRNASEGKRVPRRGSLMQRLARSDFYRYGLKPLLPTAMRDMAKAAVLPEAIEAEVELTPELHAEIGRRLNAASN